MSGMSGTSLITGGGLLFAAFAGLVGCKAADPVSAAFVYPTVNVTPVAFSHTVYFPVDADDIGRGEAARLQQFLDLLPRDQRLSVEVRGHDDHASGFPLSQRARAIEDLLRDRSFASIAISPTGPDDAGAAAGGASEPRQPLEHRVQVMVTGYVVELPDCPNWSRDVAYDPRNLPLSNLGCANAVSLGLMIADPRDLVEGRSLGTADGVREAEAVVRYRTDKAKELKVIEIEQ